MTAGLTVKMSGAHPRPRRSTPFRSTVKMSGAHPRPRRSTPFRSGVCVRSIDCSRKAAYAEFTNLTPPAARQSRRCGRSNLANHGLRGPSMPPQRPCHRLSATCLPLIALGGGLPHASWADRSRPSGPGWRLTPRPLAGRPPAAPIESTAIRQNPESAQTPALGACGRPHKTDRRTDRPSRTSPATRPAPA